MKKIDRLTFVVVLCTTLYLMGFILWLLWEKA